MHTLFVEHTLWVLFGAVLVDQLGLPLPAAPVLLAAGIEVHTGALQAGPALAAAVAASLMGHGAWFWAGRRRGVTMLRRACGLSLEPDACVQRSQDLFARLGPWSLLAVRFVPGLDILAQPVAGMAGMAPPLYLALSVVGATWWAGTFLAVGAIWGLQAEVWAAPLLQLLGGSLRVLAAAAVAWVAVKLWRRLQLLRRLDVPRITADEVHARLARGEAVVLVDVRHALEVRLHPATLPGAIRRDRHRLEAELRGRQPPPLVVPFCNCPHELGSAGLSLWLHQRGLGRAMPLAGGLQAWESRGFPLTATRRPKA